MKFYLSIAEDLIDSRYDFLNDEHPSDRDRWHDDVYAYQLFGEPVSDGIFLSAVSMPRVRERVEAAGSVQKFLHVPQEFPIMGDCGAFHYQDKNKPPYKTEDVIGTYQRHGYTFGASVDHLVDHKASSAEKQRRWELTLQNARDFIEQYQMGGFTFTPIGVAQGWDEISYREAVEQLLNFGYKYIAVGGITRLHIKQLKPILEQISAIVPCDISLHLLGVARLSDIDLFQRSHVTSLNGSTPVRRGTMGEYWALAGKKYEAIRIPFADKDRRQYHSSGGLKRLDDIIESETSLKNLISLEQKCLVLLRAYDRGEVSIEEVLESVLHYNRLNGIEDRRAKYVQILKETPWRSCPCEICRAVGIEVVIFRGNDRNRRRGFHNCWVFHRQLHKALLEGKRSQ